MPAPVGFSMMGLVILTGESNHGTDPDGRSDDLKSGQQFDVQTDQSTSLLALSAF
jgi:hypothetical protein